MRRLLAFCPVVLVSLLALNGARGQAAVLDQSSTDASGYEHIRLNASLSQTFTPAIDGWLDHVSFRILLRNPFDVYPFTVSVVETQDGSPTGRVLGKKSFSDYVSQFGWNDVSFPPAALFLRSNVVYALVLTSDAFSTTIDFSTSVRGNSYIRGTLWLKSSASEWQPAPEEDLLFQTYMGSGLPVVWMATPLPAS